MAVTNGESPLLEKYHAVIEENKKLMATQAPETFSDAVSENTFSIGDSLLGGIADWELVAGAPETDQARTSGPHHGFYSCSLHRCRDQPEAQACPEAEPRHKASSSRAANLMIPNSGNVEASTQLLRVGETYEGQAHTHAIKSADNVEDSLKLASVISACAPVGGVTAGTALTLDKSLARPAVATLQQQAWEEIEKRLLPIETKMEAMCEEMHRTANQVVGEVRALTAKLNSNVTDLPFANTVATSNLSLEVKPKSSSAIENRIAEEAATSAGVTFADKAVETSALGQSCTVVPNNEHPATNFPIASVDALRQGAGRLPTFQSIVASSSQSLHGSLPSKIPAVANPTSFTTRIAPTFTQSVDADRTPDYMAANEPSQSLSKASQALVPNSGRAKAKQAEIGNALNWPTNVHELQRSLSQVSEKLQQSEEEARQLKRQVAQLQDSLEQRDFELASRPTHRCVQQLKNEISKLERQLNPDRDVLRKNTKTIELIRRDKRKQSLDRKRQAQGLSAISDIAKEELERTVSTICATLRVSKLQDVERTTQHLADIVEQHLPHLEQFAGKVFKLVQDAESVTAPKSKLTAGKVFAQLCAWRDGALRDQTRLR